MGRTGLTVAIAALGAVLVVGGGLAVWGLSVQQRQLEDLREERTQLREELAALEARVEAAEQQGGSGGLLDGLFEGDGEGVLDGLFGGDGEAGELFNGDGDGGDLLDGLFDGEGEAGELFDELFEAGDEPAGEDTERG